MNQNSYRTNRVRYKGYKIILSHLVESELKDERTRLEQMKTGLNALHA